MKTFILNYHQKTCLKYGLNASDILLLDWIENIQSYLECSEFDTYTDPKTNKFYYHLNYSLILDNLPLVFRNITALMKSIKKISSKDAYDKPIIRHSIRTVGGTKVFFALNPPVIDTEFRRR
jgi:protein tyrosine phosphatase